METDLDRLLNLIGRQAVEIDLLRSQVQALQDQVRKLLAEREIEQAKAND